MTPDSSDFRSCYRHPRRPATRECINCERPICGRCEQESGDPLLCKKCKDELDALDKTPFDRMLRDAKVTQSKRQAPAAVGEVTITRDGKIEAPEPAAPAVAAEEPARRQEAEPVETEPVPTGPAARRRMRAEPTRRRVTEVRSQAGPAEEPETEPEESEDEEELERQRQEFWAARRERRPAKPPRDTTGPAWQTLHGLGYGVAAALIMCGLWLLFAQLAKQWSQVSVLTIGIVVPWAIYKGSMRRKLSGVKPWSEPPPPAWISVPSLLITAAVSIGLQPLAYKIIYGVNLYRLPFSDFMERFFTGFGWTLAILGLLAAVAVPFILVRGREWRKPALKLAREDSRGEGDEEDAGVS